MAGSLDVLVARLEAAVTRLEAMDGTTMRALPSAPLASSKTSGSAGAPSVVAFDALLSTYVAHLVVAAKAIGGPIFASTTALESAFVAERTVVLAMSQCKAPCAADLQVLLLPVIEAISKANALTEGKRSDAFNQQKAVAESLVALSWVAYTGKDCGLSLPRAHVEETWQAAEFFNNKALVQYKNVDDKQVAWCKALKELYIPGLRDYVKEFHTSGPAWNPSGGNITQFRTDESSLAPLPSPHGLPPPPPPKAPPSPNFGLQASSPASPAPGPSMSEVFNQINQGEDVTKGLRKVTDGMKTKNRKDRSGAVPVVEKAATGATDKAFAGPKVGKPVFDLQMDRKWVIENQIDRKDLIISDCNSKQSVYVYGCKGSVIQLQGKVNNITLDKCSKTALVFQDVVAACEIVNCTSVEMQCLGTVPTIAVDNTSGCLLYLSERSLTVGITTAKSSEVNIQVPGATEGADPVEHALPEQFLNEYKNGQWVCTAVTHSGG